ncbi:MAG: glutathione S-transferase N-terminal domain-containing protein, partial [Pseudomonadota bacterium]
MSYTLFSSPGSAAMVVRILLDDIGADYDLIDVPISKSETRDPAHLAHNPNGWVPALVWDGGSMYEAAAITVYLCDRYTDAGLGPRFDEEERPVFLQTLVYFSNTVQTAFQQYYYPERFAEH